MTMRLVFIHGPPAVGKLTVARELSALCGLPVFHNHLVVDAVAAVFPFGSDGFVRLREAWWMDAFAEAVVEGRSLIFTFQPESSVAEDFPTRVREVVESAGGRIDFVRLTVAGDEQERRIDAASRLEFGKLKSVDLLRELRGQFDAAEATMPSSSIEIDTGEVPPVVAARQIADALSLSA